MTTLKDVAVEADVSIMTVSRVINSPGKVDRDTFEKITRIMEKLQYVPNIAARNLANKRVGVIDVYIPENIDLSNPFAMHFIAGISQTLSQDLYSFLILRNLNTEHICDGYIVTGLLKDEIADFYQYSSGYGRPIVLFGRTDIEDVDCFDVDNVTGAYMAAQHLIESGHTRLCMLNVDEDKDYTADRQEGFCRALQEAGLSTHDAIMIRAVNNPDGGYLATRNLLKDTSVQGTAVFTGMFCATDTLALGAARAISETGRSIPGDISMVGFDGLGHNLLMAPPLTSVRQPVFEVGAMMARKLLDRLNGDRNREKSLVKPSLSMGHSVARFERKAV